QRPPVRLRREHQTALLEPGQQERINGIADALRSADSWNGVGPDRLKRPEGALLRSDVHPLLQGLRFRSLGPCASGNPASNRLDFFGRQLLFGRRHIAIADTLKEQAFLRLAGNDGRTGISALDRQAPQPQVESAPQFFALPVTVETVDLEE